MNFLELNKKAKEIALKNLDRGFDWQAFLVLSIAVQNEERMWEPVDVVPESNVDEGIKTLLNMFAEYINTKRAYCAGTATEKDVEERLEKYLKQNERIYKELLFSCDTEREKEIIKKHMEELKKMG